MTRECFREVLDEYGVIGITSIIPEKVTEEELRRVLAILTSYNKEENNEKETN